MLGVAQPSAAAAADAMASAYDDYASGAMFGASTPQILPTAKDAMAATILAAIATPETGSPASISGAWASGVAAYWLGVPVVGAQSGATAGCPGAASLTASLSAVFANTANTAAICAQGMAAALHAATMTVTATVAPPAGTVLPIA
jgi:hypothetical protein